jgi:hypothetical protein
MKRILVRTAYHHIVRHKLQDKEREEAQDDMENRAGKKRDR